MPHTSSENAGRQPGATPFTQSKTSFALVVGNSPINRVVVAKIAERAGLRVLSETPQHAAAVLVSLCPGIVILDGGPNDSDCDALMESLAAQRLIMGGRMPFVILLSNTNPKAGQETQGGMIDAIVAKPITPDRLQPLIRDTVERMRNQHGS